MFVKVIVQCHMSETDVFGLFLAVRNQPELERKPETSNTASRGSIAVILIFYVLFGAFWKFTFSLENAIFMPVVESRRRTAPQLGTPHDY